MAAPWFFLYQQKGGEDPWVLTLADRRAEIESSVKPAFVTVLDLSSVPDDNDWTKVRYRGPLYFDFDADGDLDLACTQFRVFLGKLSGDLNFDVTQARLFASGGKGFHCEVPQECFLPKLPVAGTPWLPYIYHTIAQSVMVDTLDLRVYSGKRGRMWRTVDVQRENGNYKVPLSVEDALTITPDLYLQLVSEPRPPIVPTPPSCNSALAMLFERSRDKVTATMRGKKKRALQADAFLDPWRKARKTPPSIEGLMDGTLVNHGVGFQQLSMQLAIYASSVGMPLEEFLDRCKGVCENHVSDSARYGTPAKRREELARMWRYMEDSTLYDFEIGPLVRLIKPGTPTPDLGVMEKDDSGDVTNKAAAPDGDTDSNPDGVVVSDDHKGIRKGVFMNGSGIWSQKGDLTESLCRASFRDVQAFYEIQSNTFRGYEFDLIAKGMKTKREMLSSEAFTSSLNMKKFFAAHQMSYQGGDAESIALLDIMTDRASRNGGKVYVWPREGLFVVDNPHHPTPEPTKVYLTQTHYAASVKEGDDDYFRMRYRPEQAKSSYNIDIHRAPPLDPSMANKLHDLFSFTRERELADMLGWMLACHYRSFYLYLFNQFPLLQVYGEAGAGKSQTIWMLAHLHWYMTPISVKSAIACTPFAMDSHASGSTSAPFILDEYKPREMRMKKGTYEKAKDVMKASYIAGDIGERGTVNRGAESNLAVVKSQATAPIVFIGEAIEMETAIIERSVIVNLTKQTQTAPRVAAFNRLHDDNPEVLSSLGRTFMELGLTINLAKMKAEVDAIRQEIEAGLPSHDDQSRKRAAPRMVFNRAVVLHALHTCKKVLHMTFGSEFDLAMDGLINAKRVETPDDARTVTMHGMSEISKVMNRIALLTREQDQPWTLVHGKDYLVGSGWIEIKVERAYDQYRRYCASIHDTPLFDTLEVFGYALNSYTPCVDRSCASSEIRAEDSSERIIRLNLAAMRKEGVQSFKQ